MDTRGGDYSFLGADMSTSIQRRRVPQPDSPSMPGVSSASPDNEVGVGGKQPGKDLHPAGSVQYTGIAQAFRVLSLIFYFFSACCTYASYPTNSCDSDTRLTILLSVSMPLKCWARRYIISTETITTPTCL